MIIQVITADYANPKHQRAIPALMNAYAKDPMGGAKGLSEAVKANLVYALSKQTQAFSILAYADQQPVGLANCFEGFSTFACKPLINIHDFFVLEAYRGNGISQLMLNKVEEVATARKCCKITLEVLSNNEVAKASYRKFGFSDYQLTPEAGTAMFWQKKI